MPGSMRPRERRGPARRWPADPSQRLQVIINFNNDIGDYMEWSGGGWYPVNLSNDAYKFATNYVVYGLTH